MQGRIAQLGYTGLHGKDDRLIWTVERHNAALFVDLIATAYEAGRHV